MTAEPDSYARLATFVERIARQDEWWLTGDGRWVRVDDMDADHRRNLLALLRRNARQLHMAYGTWLMTGPEPSGDAARDAYEHVIAVHELATPDEWLEDTPLVRKLSTLQHREDSRIGARLRRGFYNLGEAFR